tara:strand:- start:258 stop:359 length:102 start_codon:yes stop_codon:yes gene_type:complete
VFVVVGTIGIEAKIAEHWYWLVLVGIGWYWYCD